MNLFTGLLTFAVLLLASAASSGEKSTFQPWSENLFRQIEIDHGTAALRRMRKLHEIVATNYHQPIRKKLEIANTTMNHLPWIADQQKYRKNDYWASPMETIATFGGDCEDIAIAKYMILRAMAVPTENMNLAYVKLKRTGEAHMVLVYVEHPSAPVGSMGGLVLDNMIASIKSAKQRDDLTAVYMVDSDNTVMLLGDNGNTRDIAGIVKNAKHQKLNSVRRRIDDTRARYIEYNDGRVLF